VRFESIKYDINVTDADDSLTETASGQQQLRLADSHELVENLVKKRVSDLTYDFA